MYPILFTVPGIGFELYSFGVMVLLGAFLGLEWIKREAERRGLDGENVHSLAVWIFLSGLIGTRVFFVVMNWDALYADEPFYQVFNIRQGGLVWYGGPLAAIPVAAWLMRVYKLHPLVVSDILVQGLVLGHALGRIGCLLVGDDFGKVWTPDMWWPEWATLTFTDERALLPEAFKGKPLLPAQPLMALGNFAIFGVLVALRKRLAVKPGSVAALYFVLYAPHRFLVELTRGDDIRGFIGPFSTSQFVSLLVIGPAVGCLIYFLRRQPTDGELQQALPEGEYERLEGAAAKPGEPAEKAEKAEPGEAAAAAEPAAPSDLPEAAEQGDPAERRREERERGL